MPEVVTVTAEAEVDGQVAEKLRLRAKGFHTARGLRWETREQLVKILMAKQGILDERDIPPEIEAIANETVEMRNELLDNPCLIWDMEFVSIESVDWRRGLHRFLERPDSSVTAWWFNVFYFVFLLLAISWNVMETLPAFRHDRKTLVHSIDYVFLSMYSLEVAVRLCAVRYWREYLMQVATWVDWVTVIAFAVSLGGVDTSDILWLEIFRHFRPILRLLKETKRFSGIQLLVNALKLSADALLIPLFTVTLWAVLSGNILYVAERDAASPTDPSQPNIKSITDGAWIVMYTVSTVGYGNAPVTVEGKIVDSIIIIAGIVFLAIPIGIVGSNFDRVWKLRELMAFMDLVKRKLRDFGFERNDVEFIFRSFDLTRDELLDFGEFGQCVRKVGLKFKVEVLGDMFRIFDDDASGIITYKEFLKGLQGKSIFPSRVLFEGIHGIVKVDRTTSEAPRNEGKDRVRNRRVLETRKAVFEGALDWIPGLNINDRKQLAQRKRRLALVHEP